MITNSICSCLYYVLILDLEDTVADQETRLTAAEENIQDSFDTTILSNLLLMFSAPVPQNY